MDSDAQYTFGHGGGKSGEFHGTLARLTPGGLPIGPLGRTLKKATMPR